MSHNVESTLRQHRRTDRSPGRRSLPIRDRENRRISPRREARAELRARQLELELEDLTEV